MDCGCSSKFVQKVTHIHIVTACQWFSKINSKKPVMVAIYNSMHDLWLRGKGGTWESEIYPQMVSLSYAKKNFVG